MGHAAPFAFEDGYRGAGDIRRGQCPEQRDRGQRAADDGVGGEVRAGPDREPGAREPRDRPHDEVGHEGELGEREHDPPDRVETEPAHDVPDRGAPGDDPERGDGGRHGEQEGEREQSGSGTGPHGGGHAGPHGPGQLTPCGRLGPRQDPRPARGGTGSKETVTGGSRRQQKASRQGGFLFGDEPECRVQG